MTPFRPALPEGGDAVRGDGNPAVRAAAGDLAGPQATVGPHVELDLFGQSKVVVGDVGQPVTRPGPGLDFEYQPIAFAEGAELDLTGLQMTAKGGQAERGRAGAVTRTGPSHGPGMCTV